MGISGYEPLILFKDPLPAWAPDTWRENGVSLVADSCGDGQGGIGLGLVADNETPWHGGFNGDEPGLMCIVNADTLRGILGLLRAVLDAHEREEQCSPGALCAACRRSPPLEMTR